MEEIETRAGYVALVGRPNVGKSTLLNALIGERLSIVTARAQTTRERVFGLHSTEDVQIVFVDTPGLLEPKYLLQESMLEAALSTLADADVALLLLDPTRPTEFPSAEALDLLRGRGEALFVCINKVDAADEAAIATLERWSLETLAVPPRRISAAEGQGVRELLAALEAAMPESPFFYPADDIAVQPVRFFVAEFIRETVFEEYEEEVPYSTVVRVEEFREEDDPLYIGATVFVERESQKGIIIGRGGAGIKRLGARSREKIEAFLGRRVYLDLWVKAMPRWRKKAGSLKFLGYAVGPDRD